MEMKKGLNSEKSNPKNRGCVYKYTSPEQTNQ